MTPSKQFAFTTVDLLAKLVKMYCTSVVAGCDDFSNQTKSGSNYAQRNNSNNGLKYVFSTCHAGYVSNAIRAEFVEDVCGQLLGEPA